MPQIFSPAANTWLKASIVGGALLVSTVIGTILYLGSTSYVTRQHQIRPQPVPFSHRHHVNQLGIDCRYCHTSVEISEEAIIPPTETCMNCHSIVDNGSEDLNKLIDSWHNKEPIEWVRVHMLPDYAFFNHSVHVNAGVGCASCHGRVDHMEKVMQVEPLSMSWCLDCHRNPENHLRPLDQVTNMDWMPSDHHSELAKIYINERNISPPEDCTACHR